MSWLPAIVFAGSRWWLPLSRPAVDLLSAILLEANPSEDCLSEKSSPRSCIKTRVPELVALMQQDPPLTIFTAFKLAESLQGESVSVERLAEASIEHWSTWLSTGDGFLGMPPDRDAFVPHWQELHDSFIRRPYSSWCANADQWLVLTGPLVAEAFRNYLPSLADDDQAMIVGESDSHRYEASSLDLSRLARRLRVTNQLESAFDEAIQESKRAALKQFAYGLSHEINNPLANISARAQGLMREEPHPDRVNSLQRIIDQSMRAHEMVADLMFYAHPPKPNLGDADAKPLLQAVINQTQPSIQGRGIEFRLVDQSPPLFQADRAMMLEAIRSLVRNSIEAIGCDGVIELVCSPGVNQGKAGVVFEVRDSGPGLSEEARIHAFDPYFSGREAGRGLGVGLCRVERIAKLHRGTISLISGPAGCTARLWIPVRP
jgi:signal transduction histidine kinase